MSVIRPQEKFEQGFTLLEILIAIVILSMLMLSIFTIVDRSISTQESITKEDREALQIETALSRFAIDYTQIWSPLFYSAQEKVVSEEDSFDQPNTQKFEASPVFPITTTAGHPVPVIENPSKTELVFYTISNRRKVQESRQSNFAWVNYKIQGSTKKDDTGEESRAGDLELIRKYSSSNPYAKEFNWGRVKSQVLLRNIKDFSFEFWNSKSKKFVDSVRDIGSNLYRPTAVRITIVWVDINKIEHQVSRIFRPLWPYFDPSTDKPKRKKQLNTSSLNEEF